MNELPFITDPLQLKDILRELRLTRRKAKTKQKRKYSLSKLERSSIHEKTDGKCHVCGQDVPIDKFEADHVKSHSKGGKDSTDKFSCYL